MSSDGKTDDQKFNETLKRMLETPPKTNKPAPKKVWDAEISAEGGDPGPYQKIKISGISSRRP